MKRKTSTTPTRIYSYWVFPPTPEESGDLERQFELARRYKNELLNIELERLKQAREVFLAQPHIGEQSEKIEALRKELFEVRGAIKASRAKERARVDTAPLDRRAKELVASFKEASTLLKAMRQEIKPADVKKKLVAIEEASREATKKARAAIVEAGLYWGTYLLVERQIEAARKSKRDPKFRKWDGSGRVGVQLQKGAPVSNLYSDAETIDRRFYISADAVDPRKEKDKRRHVFLRIGSTETKKPIFFQLTAIFHRPLPSDGKVVYVWLARRLVVDAPPKRKFVYELQITVEAPSFGVSRAIPAGYAERQDACGIDVGWRAIDETLRFGYLAGADGSEEELRLPEGLVRRFLTVEKIATKRDLLFNETKKKIVELAAGAELPAWLTEVLSHLPQWRSLLRLQRLAWDWRQRRFAGDETLYSTIEQWRRIDKRMYLEVTGIRNHALGHRKDYYRNVAIDIARRWKTVYIERFDLRQVARLVVAEDKDALPSAARHNRQIAAISEFRQALKHAMAAHGGLCIEIPAQHTTTICHACGFQGEWNKAVELVHVCTSCGRRWDQDKNAAMNLLCRGLGDMNMATPETSAIEVRT